MTNTSDIITEESVILRKKQITFKFNHILITELIIRIMNKIINKKKFYIKILVI